MNIMTLWQPILLSAVLTFIAGSVIWIARLNAILG